MTAALSTETQIAILAEKITALSNHVTSEFQSRDKAVSTALTAMEHRLDGMNEFRGSLKDQATILLPREEYMTSHVALVRELDQLKSDLVPRPEVMGIIDRVASRLTAMEHDASVRVGRQMVWSIVMTMVVAGVSLLTLLLHFRLGG